MRWIIRYGIGLLVWLPGKLNAQQVLYAESLHTRPSVYFQLVGKSEPWYWVEKIQKQKSFNRHLPGITTDLLSFGLLDPRLNLLGEYAGNPFTRNPETMADQRQAGNGSVDGDP